MNNFLIWCGQVAVLMAACEVASRFVGSPRARLWLWQTMLAFTLLLPTIEPWNQPPPVWITRATFVFPVDPLANAPTTLWAYQWQWSDILIAGAALRLLWLGVGLLRLVRMRQRARPIPPPIATYSREIAWYASAEVRGPATFGRYSILLPENVLDMTPSAREAIARHELRHAERRDWIMVLAEETLRAVLWFHPAVWWALHRVQLAREQVIDREVVAAMGDQTPYLEALIAVAANGTLSPYAPAPTFLNTFLNKGQLAQRVAAILKETPMSKKMLALRFCGAMALMLAAFVAITATLPFQAEAQILVRPQAAARPEVAQAPPAPPPPTPAPNRGGRGQQPPSPDTPTQPPPQEGLPRISQAIAQGKLISQVVPIYPQPAQTARIQGAVIMNIQIDAEGHVQDIKVDSGPPLLRQAAMEAVRQWVYQPFMMNGAPTTVVTQVTVNFFLQ